MNYFKIKTDKNVLSYHAGETATFTVKAYNNCIETPCRYVKWILEGDDGTLKKGLDAVPFTLETTCTRPGFVHVRLIALNTCNEEDNNFVPYDGSIGFDIDQIEYADQIPKDYDTFWQGVRDMVNNHNIEVINCRPVTENVEEGFEAFDIQLTTPIATQTSAVLTLPKTDKKMNLECFFNGYGYSPAVPICKKDTICFKINAHGIENTKNYTELTAKYMGNENYGFDEKENQKPETTYYYGMIIRDLIGVKYAKTLKQWNHRGLIMNGGSQGAFQSVLMAANDPDVTYLDLEIPWFCNLNAESKGYMAGWRPKFQSGLSYFDTAAAATRVNCPVYIKAFLGDYVCPPATVMVLYKSFKAAKAIDFVQGGTHSYRPPEIEACHYRHENGVDLTEVKPGIYKHYKGNRYEVLFTSTNSETLEKTVVYKALYGDGKIWVRPAYMFQESVLVDGLAVKRFTKE